MAGFEPSAERFGKVHVNDPNEARNCDFSWTEWCILVLPDTPWHALSARRLCRVRVTVLEGARRPPKSRVTTRPYGLDMSFDPPILRTIADSQCPECGSRMATPLLSAGPDYPYGDHVQVVCDACAHRRVVSIGRPAA